jgi:hypothetical protein
MTTLIIFPPFGYFFSEYSYQASVVDLLLWSPNTSTLPHLESLTSHLHIGILSCILVLKLHLKLHFTWTYAIFLAMQILKGFDDGV